MSVVTKMMRQTLREPLGDTVEAGSGSDDSRTACGRVLAVLSAFSKRDCSLSLSDISRRAGLTLTTTHRLVHELTAWGALERDDSRRYRVGIRLLELASFSSSRGLDLRELAMPHIADLHAATHETVDLAVRVGLEVVYIERLQMPGGVDVPGRIGGRGPLHATGVGLVLLAYASYDVQEQVLNGPLQRFTGKTICDSRTLRRALAEVRRTTVAVADGDIAPDALAVAGPVRGPGNDVVAALGVVARSERCSPSCLVWTVNAAARRISDALGAPQPPTRGAR